ncbi:MAG TPA: hypothetical protein VKA45_11560 [Gaiellaceae bacterium]|nr:hypothetical protein [Gaiellaceae bacterium]
MRITLALTASLCTLAVASGAGAMPAAKPPPKPPKPPKPAKKSPLCTSTVTGPVAADLVVPPGATCDASGAVVQGRVRVGRNATLSATSAFRARRAIAVSRGATLELVGTQLSIGGNVEAHGAKKVALVREPFAGSRGTIGGSILLFDTADVSLLSLTIGGGVLVRGGGGEGVEVGASRLFRSLEVTGARMLHPAQPRVFSVRSNIVSRHVTVSRNNATGAISPLFVGGNRLLNGNLTCRRNVPAPVNSGLGGTKRNVVMHGAKRGQCASL